jgi:hypothetical protein
LNCGTPYCLTIQQKALVLDPNLGLVSRRRSSHLSCTFEVRTSTTSAPLPPCTSCPLTIFLPNSHSLHLQTSAAHDIATAHRILRGDRTRHRPHYGLLTLPVAMADSARWRAPRDTNMASERHGGREDAGGLLHTRPTRRAKATVEDARRVSQRGLQGVTYSALTVVRQTH